MEDIIKFRWEGASENETGLAIYEIGTSTYSLRLPNIHSAKLVHMALSRTYQEGYEDGIRNTQTVIRSTLLTVLENAQNMLSTRKEY